jgi:hypothetical protein
MVTPFSRPPAPMNRMPGSRRLSHKQIAAMTYDAMCAAASAVGWVSGMIEMTRIWSASATHSDQACRIRRPARRFSGAPVSATTSSIATAR